MRVVVVEGEFVQVVMLLHPEVGVVDQVVDLRHILELSVVDVQFPVTEIVVVVQYHLRELDLSEAVVVVVNVNLDVQY